MTNKQQELYDVLLDYYNNHWKMPTLGDLSKRLGKSRSNIWVLLRKLESIGLIRIEKKKYRGIELVGVIDDKCIYYSESDIETKKNDKHGFSKSDKFSGGTFWNTRKN